MMLPWPHSGSLLQVPRRRMLPAHSGSAAGSRTARVPASESARAAALPRSHCTLPPVTLIAGGSAVDRCQPRPTRPVIVKCLTGFTFQERDGRWRNRRNDRIVTGEITVTPPTGAGRASVSCAGVLDRYRSASVLPTIEAARGVTLTIADPVKDPLKLASMLGLSSGYRCRLTQTQSSPAAIVTDDGTATIPGLSEIIVTTRPPAGAGVPSVTVRLPLEYVSVDVDAGVRRHPSAGS